jgi:metal-responsive CopG/Arc/MetJ family transcriptional regulator
MRRATITLPSDLEAEVDDYLATQEPRPSLTALIQSALRRYLAERRLAEREYLPPVGPYESYVAEEGSGYDDVSEEHDRHLADRE